MQNKTKLERLIELQKRIILLLKAIDRKIENLQTYEDENVKIIISLDNFHNSNNSNDPRFWSKVEVPDQGE